MNGRKACPCPHHLNGCIRGIHAKCRLKCSDQWFSWISRGVTNLSTFLILTRSEEIVLFFSWKLLIIAHEKNIRQTNFVQEFLATLARNCKSFCRLFPLAKYTACCTEAWGFRCISASWKWTHGNRSCMIDLNLVTQRGQNSRNQSTFLKQ